MPTPYTANRFRGSAHIMASAHPVHILREDRGGKVLEGVLATVKWH